MHRAFITCVFALSGALVVAPRAIAATLVNLTTTVWGCFDPNVTPEMNDPTNPKLRDPQWVAQTSSVGQCSLLSGGPFWSVLSPDFHGLTYIGRSGAGVQPASYWVPTDAINFATAVQVPVSPPPSTAPPSPSATASATTTQQAAPVPVPQPQQSNGSQESQPTPRSDQDVSASQTPSSPAPPDDQSPGAWLLLAVIVFAALILATKINRGNREKSSLRKATQIAAESKSATRSVSKVGPVPKIQDTPELPPATSAAPEGKTNSPKPAVVSVASPSGIKTSKAISWYAFGQTFTLAGFTISNGMVYVGKPTGSWGQHDASFIDPALPVAASSTAAEPLSYYPSYKALSAAGRCKYLEWLASGKNDPGQDIGYVFIYFYGLERRIIVDKPSAMELKQLTGEVRRLRSIYGSGGSFRYYAENLVDAAEFRQVAELSDLSDYNPDLSSAEEKWRLPLRLAIARHAANGSPLKFELAAAALIAMADLWVPQRAVLTAGRAVFLQLAKARFVEEFPAGYVPEVLKTEQMRAEYRGAAAGMQIDLLDQSGLKNLPEPKELSWDRLVAMARIVAQELLPYAKALAYHPARANALYALVECPAAIRDTVALKDRAWLESLPELASVPFGELAGHAIGITTAKWTVVHRRQVSDALAGAGFAMVPLPEDNSVRLEDEMPVFVFRSSEAELPAPVDAVAMSIALVAMVTVATSSAPDAIANKWLSAVRTRVAITQEQSNRLRAHLIWATAKPVTLAVAKKYYSEATPGQQAFCAWSVTEAALASGPAIRKPAIALLEAIYDFLKVPRATLYKALHEGFANFTPAAKEPILVSDGAPDILHLIPQAPDRDSDAARARLDKIRAETAHVTAILADVYADDDVAPPAVAPAEGGVFEGLDMQHGDFLATLLGRNAWSRPDFDAAATAAGLMPNGALETINEWAFEAYEDAILEDGDPVIVNRALLPANSGQPRSKASQFEAVTPRTIGDE